MNAHKDALKSDRSPGILPAVCESVRFGSAGGSCSGPLWGWRCDCHCVAVTLVADALMIVRHLCTSDW